jgi:uncharacterized protein (TIGR01777 family)
MKVIITGGTGFIGTALTSELVARGHHVAVIDRSPQRHTELPGVTYYHADLLTDRLKPEWFDGMDVVVHLAGRSLLGVWTPAYKRSLYDSRVVSAQHIVDIVSKLPDESRPRAVVSANAIGYYGNRGDEELREDAKPGDDFLAKLCQDWQTVWDPLLRLGVRVVTIRTGIVLQVSGGMLGRLLPIFKLNMGAVIGSGKQWFSWIGLNDLVRLYVAAIEKSEVSGPINAVAPEPLTNREFTRQLAQALHRKTFLRLPGVFLYAAGADIASTLLGSQRVLPHKLSELRFEYDTPTIRDVVQTE